MQTFGAFVCVILIFVGTMWLRHWFYAGGTRRVASGRTPVDSAAPINLNATQYERLDWELKHRGFTPADIGAPYSDFLFGNEVTVEVMPASAGLYRVNIRSGVAKSIAQEALRVARNSS